jgi:alkanesulfonate monooxygenase SsuD/methylene tetrahydromethanopterin reductase-like flavin-dependent oxidoreductase (luciferase family)
MKLGFFTQPVHPPTRDYAETLAEDREIFALADRLGFAEAYCGEHLADTIENVPSSLLFLASLVDSTNTMKLGTAVLNLPFTHPVVAATNVAMLDNMLRGRLLLGVGAGIGLADAEALDLLEADRNAMFEEAISQMQEIWAGEPPYEISGEFWNISTDRTLWPDLGLGAMVKPYQRPHPPILGASGDPRSGRLAAMGARGWLLMSSDTIPASRLAEQWERYAEGAREAGLLADREQWRVVRSVFVCEDERKARSYGKTDADSPYRQHFGHLLTKFARSRALAGVKADPAMPDEAVTLDYFVEECVIAGCVQQVVEELLAVHEAAGSFGTVVYAGKNWTDPDLSRRSMELMAQEVLPAVNAALGRKPATPAVDSALDAPAGDVATDTPAVEAARVAGVVA